MIERQMCALKNFLTNRSCLWVATPSLKEMKYPNLTICDHKIIISSSIYIH